MPLFRSIFNCKYFSVLFKNVQIKRRRKKKLSTVNELMIGSVVYFGWGQTMACLIEQNTNHRSSVQNIAHIKLCFIYRETHNQSRYNNNQNSERYLMYKVHFQFNNIFHWNALFWFSAFVLFVVVFCFPLLSFIFFLVCGFIICCDLFLYPDENTVVRNGN